jgi:hypothetical protein
MMHQSVEWQPPSVEVNRVHTVFKDIPVELWGVATLQPNGLYQCYANVGGALCIVEVRITAGETFEVAGTPGRGGPCLSTVYDAEWECEKGARGCRRHAKARQT